MFKLLLIKCFGVFWRCEFSNNTYLFVSSNVSLIEYSNESWHVSSPVSLSDWISKMQTFSFLGCIKCETGFWLNLVVVIVILHTKSLIYTYS